MKALERLAFEEERSFHLFSFWYSLLPIPKAYKSLFFISYEIQVIHYQSASCDQSFVPVLLKWCSQEEKWSVWTSWVANFTRELKAYGQNATHVPLAGGCDAANSVVQW